MSQRKNTKADCCLTAQKFKKSKEVFDKYKIQPLEVHVWRRPCKDVLPVHSRNILCAECYASHRIEEDRRNNHEAEFDFFFENIHPICRTVQLCRISIICVSCYIYKCITEKGLFIYIPHFSVGRFVDKK